MFNFHITIVMNNDTVLNPVQTNTVISLRSCCISSIYTKLNFHNGLWLITT